MALFISYQTLGTCVIVGLGLVMLGYLLFFIWASGMVLNPVAANQRVVKLAIGIHVLESVISNNNAGQVWNTLAATIAVLYPQPTPVALLTLFNRIDAALSPMVCDHTGWCPATAARELHRKIIGNLRYGGLAPNPIVISDEVIKAIRKSNRV
jgi:hypothetical protein